VGVIRSGGADVGAGVCGSSDLGQPDDRRPSHLVGSSDLGADDAACHHRSHPEPGPWWLDNHCAGEVDDDRGHDHAGHSDDARSGAVSGKYRERCPLRSQPGPDEPGLPALRVRPDLQAKAQGWADRMARENALYHSRLSDGLATCWTGLGENLARSDSVAGAEQGLMRSSLHLSNILGRWDWVGVGVARTGSGFVVVQVFMSGCL